MLLYRNLFTQLYSHIGLENAKLISENVKNISKFIEIIKKNKFNEFLNIDGIGETQIKSLKNYFLNKTNLIVLEELIKILDIKKVKINQDGILKNKTFMITGKLKLKSS